MAKTNSLEMLKELKKAKELFLSAVAQLEDTRLDHVTKKQATSIIQEAQIHTDIALEEINPE